MMTHATDAPLATEATPALIADTVQFDLASAKGGEPWRIFLHVPRSEPPEAGWPVLHLFDGNAVIATAVDALRIQSAWPSGTGVHPGVIVAVGYPTDGAYDGVRRSWDLGPPPGETYPPFTKDGPPVRTGGADDFLAFLEEELAPEIARRVKVDPLRRAVFGHSFGGLFVLHALFRRPQAYSRLISASPAIWWEGAGIVARAEGFLAEPPAGLDARLLLLAGEYEQKLAPFQIGAQDAEKRQAAFKDSRIVDYTAEMAGRLAGVPGLATSYELIGGETHMSILPQAVNKAVRFAFGVDGAA
ncbi:alpha/beta hydrolase-fold protein [Ancylobacter sp. 6x-1]|uniref:Alpha/beta hydrolase-fold protein n=1 Tax=Ancylobacter crimeensis TaxID=2579147 RepID=A0ABT0DBQ2_9HYPH|nr:alpha/beta hydrolase-fold protein [Ancylobacter crimeensis]MCK0197177.1 alpha/beta hydrolase-fold protein [Ancylobacter crimeensis]